MEDGLRLLLRLGRMDPQTDAMASSEPDYECVACGQPLSRGEAVRYADCVVCRDCEKSRREEEAVEAGTRNF